MTSVLRLFPSFSTMPPMPPQSSVISPSSDYVSILKTLCFAIIHYVRSYGASALLLTILSLITVFRREMSSNRVYLTEEEREREVRRRRRRRRTRRESEGSRDTSSSSELKLATTTSSLPNDNATNQSNIDTYKKDCHSYEEEEEEEYCDETDDLLDRAGLYCSGFGEIIKIILSVWAHMLLSQIHEGESEKKKINEDGSIPNKATKENTLFVGGAKEEETTLSSPKPSSSLSLGKKNKNYKSFSFQSQHSPISSDDQYYWKLEKPKRIVSNYYNTT
mmetsp:Transcript_11237/g.16563  ORF Transcript_11237/g.16563 Transcript_11237/m.16563 type:complete len:277 (+) Transcript_11237:202-1032(+)